MKKMNFRSLSLMLAIAATGIILGGCNKMNGETDDRGVSGIMAFNMAPDQVAVGMSLNGTPITNVPLGFNSYTGTYVAVYSGNGQFRSFSTSSGTELVNTGIVLDTNKYYSVFLLGTTGNYRHVFAEDRFSDMPTNNGKAYIRYIQAIPDSTASRITYTVGGSLILDESAPYSKISHFMPVDPGDIVVEIDNGTNVEATRTISVEARKVYTVLLIGLPNETNPELAEQIKFITNGTLPG